MTARLAQIWRFPIKAHGREALTEVTLNAGQTMPGDRLWAVAHESSQANGSEWASCSNFSRVAKAPLLAAMTARLDEANDTVTLTHPQRADLTFRPDDEGEKLIEWTKGFVPDNRPQSARVVRARARGMTDNSLPAVTLCNLSSHRAVEQRVGRELSIHRWRGNLWFDGGAPWEEFDWIGRELRIGEAILIPRERTTRCLATHANPDTGRRDADVLAALDSWGHHDFSVMAEVVQSGRIAPGDSVERI